MSNIPKVIHYCWFGGNALSKLSEDCIASWEKYCPDYEIIRWDERNFDVTINQYMKEAYESEKWAFVSDYFRLYVLYYFGGIYMDTDVELIKNIDLFLNHGAFSGFEDDKNIPTGIMGAEKNNNWIKYLLSYYESRHFVQEDGSLDMATNVKTITNMTKEKYGLTPNNTYQELADGVAIYPKDYFCPKQYQENNITITPNTFCIHHFNASWRTEEDKIRREKRIYYYKKYGNRFGEYITRLDMNVNKYGIGGTLRKIISKVFVA